MSTTTTAGSISTGQTILSATGQITTSASATTTVGLGTVPAGKTFCLTDVVLSTSNSTAFDAMLQYTLGSVTIAVFEASVSSTSPCSARFESEPTIPAGAVVSLLLPIVSGAPKIDFYIAGYCQIPVA